MSESAATNLEAYKEYLLQSKTDPSVRMIRKNSTFIGMEVYNKMCNGEVQMVRSVESFYKTTILTS